MPKKLQKGFIRKFRNAKTSEDYVDDSYAADSQTDSEGEVAMPAISEILQDIPETDEGSEEENRRQLLLRVHKNLGHPSNKLLAQILKEAKRPPTLSKWLRRFTARRVLAMFGLPRRDQLTHFEHVSQDKWLQWT